MAYVTFLCFVVELDPIFL